MPIQGVTTQRRLPRNGKIRLGIKVANQNGTEYPKAVDYFVCPPEVQAVYGETPTVLDIVLPVDAEELIAPTYYKAYSSGRGLVCKGDGISANRLIDAKQQSSEPGTGVVTGPIAGLDAESTEMALGISCPGRDCSYYENKQCREVMNLQFLLPSVAGLGVWQLDTGSYHSIVNIYSSMELIRGIFGTVAMIPLKLSLEPMEVSPNGLKRVVHVLQLSSTGTLAQIAEQRRQPIVPGLVPSPDEEREDLLFPENGFEPCPPAPAPAVSTLPEKPPGLIKWLRSTGRTTDDVKTVIAVEPTPETVSSFRREHGLKTVESFYDHLEHHWERLDIQAADGVDPAPADPPSSTPVQEERTEQSEDAGPNQSEIDGMPEPVYAPAAH